MPVRHLDEDRMWQAVVESDEQFDGQFVYAVRTTGVYCRPSCPSRKPNRENVEFFALPGEAEQSGYRPCKRCQPDTVGDTRVRLVEQICRYIEDHASEDSVGLKQLSREFSLSQFHLQRVFKRVMGITPREYADAVRLHSFKGHLRDNHSVTEAVYAAGYSSNSQLYARVDAHLGMTPTDYQAGGPSSISYALGASPFGIVLAAATPRGICAVRIGDTYEQVVDDLRSEFPLAHLAEQATLLRSALDSILRHMDGRTPRIDLPLDIRATAFQKRVWEALRGIPFGETRTYGEIAQAIGQPKAARAVGNACAANPVALVVPCHRVVRNDGRVGNYRWGRKRKEKLLDIERQGANE